MANIKVGRDSRSSSTRPMPKKTNRDSRAAERQFRALKGIQTGTVTVRNPSSSGSSQSSSNTQSNVTAARTGAGMQISPMLRTVIDNNPVVANPAQVQQLANNVFSQARNNSANASAREKEQIRAIMAPANLNQVKPFGQLSQQQQLRSALKNDIRLRERRINKRDTELSRLQTRLTSAENRLASYDKYIQNGTFIGTDRQYAQYKNAYYSYEKALNNYNRNVELQNLDIKTLKINQQSIDKKTTGKQEYNKAKAKYDIANKAVSDRLPTVEQVEPYIRQLVKTSTPVGMATQISDRILKRKDTEKIVQFSLGAYESVKQKPLKAAATFVTFAVGGVAVKGLSTAAKTLGAGAKTARAAKLIEGGMLGVYATSTGIKYASVDNAREAGFVTGDVIFNELLPAGLGMKLGVRVVNSIPKGATKIRGTGTKIKKQVQAEIPKKIQAEITKIKRQITTSKNKTGKGLTVKKAQELQTRLKTVENSFRQRRIKANQLRREIRKINQEFEAFERAEKAAMDNVRKATAKEIATLKNLSKKKNTGKITNMAKKLNAERDAKLKSGEYVEVKRSDGQVVLQKVKVKTKQLTATQQKQVQAQKQQIKTVQDVSTKATPKLKINGKVKQVNRMGAVSLLAVLAVAGNKLKISTRQLIKQKVGLVQKQATRQTQRQRTRQTQTQKPRQAVKQTPRQAVKTKQATRPRTRPSKKAKEKPPEIILPAIANLNLKSRRPKKKTKRSKKGITTTQALNKVATFKDLFG